ncbi:hypothetical protein ACRE_026610 [Hapsidospora chrysogenum ATCC 11550]|uniref:Uncharacterized protein n=1 Tax=Hapsidospora chrysogenum (strain ATCC 11550 / CBS 779.69 / DSM 880 / IAM 14645 / JCM 23072 / IMI 49137) TaxID=857340 RepID=A0A086TAV9_HAPC1|nr:hypothetical protein ACRE_026610 [Hapsidospora chrysogenum ATCC 11550]
MGGQTLCGRLAASPGITALAILNPQPLLDECETLRLNFDSMPFGVHMPLEQLQRLRYLLGLSRLPLDEDIRAEYTRRVGKAIEFRQHFDSLAQHLRRNGYEELERSTLEALDRQRRFFCSEDEVLARVIERGLEARDGGEDVASDGLREGHGLALKGQDNDGTVGSGKPDDSTRQAAAWRPQLPDIYERAEEGKGEGGMKQ